MRKKYMPKGNVPTQTRHRAIIEIMNRGIESPTEIVKILERDYGIKTTRQTVYRDIASGVEPVTEEILDEYKSSMIGNIDSLSKVAYDHGIKGDTKSMDTYTRLVKTKAEVLKKIVEIQEALQKTEIPIYEIRIGKFEAANKEDEKEKEENGKSGTD